MENILMVCWLALMYFLVFGLYVLDTEKRIKEIRAEARVTACQKFDKAYQEGRLYRKIM